MNEARDDICRKIRATVKEFGEHEMLGVAIVWGCNCEEPENYQIGGVELVYAPTIANPTLARCSHEMARFFEDI